MKKYGLILLGALLLQACASTGLLPGTPDKWTVTARLLPIAQPGMLGILYSGGMPEADKIIIYQVAGRAQAERLREELLASGLVENISIEHDN